MRYTPMRYTPMRHTHEIPAGEMHAHEMYAYEMHTKLFLNVTQVCGTRSDYSCYLRNYMGT